MKGFERFLTRPYLRAYAGLSINISSALLIVPFVGYTINLPNNLLQFLVLIFNIVLAIIFLLVSVWCERRIDK